MTSLLAENRRALVHGKEFDFFFSVEKSRVVLFKHQKQRNTVCMVHGKKFQF